MRKSVYPGDIFEAVCSMHTGDSTGFIIGAKDYFEKLERIKPPAFIDSTSVLYFSIKIDKLEAKETVEAEQQKRMEQQRKEMESAKTDEPVLMQKYLADNKIKAKPSPSGLVYVETLKGKGDNVKVGQLVTAKYTGKFLDGQIFDSSERSGKPFQFRVGKQEVIPGWDEGFQLMKKGGKATLIIPSSIAYGDGGGRMKPFATLVFDVEVVDVTNAPAVPEGPHGPAVH
jgi:FKBP-type peptidyl-prolyl cis-trans isomerase FkpA